LAGGLAVRVCTYMGIVAPIWRGWRKDCAVGKRWGDGFI